MISLLRSTRNAALAAALLLSPALAQAQPSDPEPGLLYRVVDVARGDAVPLLRHPDGDGEIVGELRWDARDVVLSGASMQADGRIWYQVVGRGAHAWIDAAHVAPQEDNRTENYPLQCLGTEPFWSVAINETAVFETPDIAPTSWTASEWLPARGLIGRYMIRLSGGYGTGYLALLRQTCSDGMSDINYPFEAIMITPGQAVRAGCCRRMGAE